MVYGQKTLESVIAGTHYIRSLRGFQMLSISVQTLKWQAFWMEKDQSSFQEELKCLENLTETLNAKDAENSFKSFKNIAANVMPLIVVFSEFTSKSKETSEVCKYWNGIVEMTKRLQNLVSADREGNWDNHIQALRDLLPIFIEADSVNYLRYHGTLKVFDNFI